jgi:hypothetical protein
MANEVRKRNKKVFGIFRLYKKYVKYIKNELIVTPTMVLPAIATIGDAAQIEAIHLIRDRGLLAPSNLILKSCC